MVNDKIRFSAGYDALNNGLYVKRLESGIAILRGAGKSHKSRLAKDIAIANAAKGTEVRYLMFYDLKKQGMPDSEYMEALKKPAKKVKQDIENLIYDILKDSKSDFSKELWAQMGHETPVAEDSKIKEAVNRISGKISVYNIKGMREGAYAADQCVIYNHILKESVTIIDPFSAIFQTGRYDGDASILVDKIWSNCNEKNSLLVIVYRTDSSAGRHYTKLESLAKCIICLHEGEEGGIKGAVIEKQPTPPVAVHLPMKDYPLRE